jgi:threonylcarbamoyladenosine tRNA methylthiotransferase MtaB
MGSKKTVALYTLGCKLNYAETATIERQFVEKGFFPVQFSEKADVYVINTCSVTSHADKKCRNIIHRAVKKSPESFVAVVGCYSQLQSEELAAIPGVDLVLGTKEKLRIFDFADDFSKREEARVHACEIMKTHEFDSSYSVSGRTRSFVKIQDGCDYFCSYCTIPLARGLSRSNTIERVLADVDEVAGKGAIEVVLTGVNIGDFGKGTEEDFYDLLKALDRNSSIWRFRISSIEPNLISDEIIDLVAKSKKFVPHFHIPMQAGCDKILQLMNRKYLREVFADRVVTIKKRIPEAGIGADVIIGFPGETEEDFLETCDFISSLPISFLHVFSYSERRNTKASRLPDKVHPAEIERRSKLLHVLAEEKRKQFYSEFAGKPAEVLFEAYNKKGKMYGFTHNYIRVEADYNKDLINKTVQVILEKEQEKELMSCKIV